MKIVMETEAGEIRHHITTEEDWDKAGGFFCPQCGQEIVRLINGVCFDCNGVNSAAFAEKQEDKASRRYYRDQLRNGTISLAQMREGRLGSQ